MRIFVALAVCLGLAGAERSSVFPPGVKPVGPFSPGIIAGDYLYVSGQGARDAAGKLPETVEAQTKQCLENIKVIVEAAGMTMDNVIYTHAYLTDMKNYDAMNKVYASFFSGVLPARSTMGVTRMPLETPVEISAIAIRDKGARKVVTQPSGKSPVPISAGIMTPDRFFISGILGRDAVTGVTPAGARGQMAVALSRLRGVLAAAKVNAKQLVHLNVYRTASMPADLVERAVRKAAPEAAVSVVEVGSLPFGTNVGITGVAAVEGASKKVYREGGKVVCASAGDTVYCSARGAEVVSEAFAGIEKGLAAMGTGLARAVANTVYLDDIDRFAKMNAVYAKSFVNDPPTRTTVQPVAAGNTGARVGVVAVR